MNSRDANRYFDQNEMCHHIRNDNLSWPQRTSEICDPWSTYDEYPPKREIARKLEQHDLINSELSCRLGARKNRLDTYLLKNDPYYRKHYYETPPSYTNHDLHNHFHEQENDPRIYRQSTSPVNDEFNDICNISDTHLHHHRVPECKHLLAASRPECMTAATGRKFATHNKGSLATDHGGRKNRAPERGNVAMSREHGHVCSDKKHAPVERRTNRANRIEKSDRNAVCRSPVHEPIMLRQPSTGPFGFANHGCSTSHNEQLQGAWRVLSESEEELEERGPEMIRPFQRSPGALPPPNKNEYMPHFNAPLKGKTFYMKPYSQKPKLNQSLYLSHLPEHGYQSADSSPRWSKCNNDLGRRNSRIKHRSGPTQQTYERVNENFPSAAKNDKFGGLKKMSFKRQSRNSYDFFQHEPIEVNTAEHSDNLHNFAGESEPWSVRLSGVNQDVINRQSEAQWDLDENLAREQHYTRFPLSDSRKGGHCPDNIYAMQSLHTIEEAYQKKGDPQKARETVSKKRNKRRGEARRLFFRRKSPKTIPSEIHSTSSESESSNRKTRHSVYPQYADVEPTLITNRNLLHEQLKESVETTPYIEIKGDWVREYTETSVSETLDLSPASNFSGDECDKLEEAGNHSEGREESDGRKVNGLQLKKRVVGSKVAKISMMFKKNKENGENKVQSSKNWKETLEEDKVKGKIVKEDELIKETGRNKGKKLRIDKVCSERVLGSTPKQVEENYTRSPNIKFSSRSCGIQVSKEICICKSADGSGTPVYEQVDSSENVLNSTTSTRTSNLLRSKEKGDSRSNQCTADNLVEKCSELFAQSVIKQSRDISSEIDESLRQLLLDHLKQEKVNLSEVREQLLNRIAGEVSSQWMDHLRDCGDVLTSIRPDSEKNVSPKPVPKSFENKEADGRALSPKAVHSSENATINPPNKESSRKIKQETAECSETVRRQESQISVQSNNSKIDQRPCTKPPRKKFVQVMTSLLPSMGPHKKITNEANRVIRKSSKEVVVAQKASSDTKISQTAFIKSTDTSRLRLLARSLDSQIKALPSIGDFELETPAEELHDRIEVPDEALEFMTRVKSKRKVSVRNRQTMRVVHKSNQIGRRRDQELHERLKEADDVDLEEIIKQNQEFTKNSNDRVEKSHNKSSITSFQKYIFGKKEIPKRKKNQENFLDKPGFDGIEEVNPQTSTTTTIVQEKLQLFGQSSSPIHKEVCKLNKAPKGKNNSSNKPAKERKNSMKPPGVHFWKELLDHKTEKTDDTAKVVPSHIENDSLSRSKRKISTKKQPTLEDGSDGTNWPGLLNEDKRQSLAFKDRRTASCTHLPAS